MCQFKNISIDNYNSKVITEKQQKHYTKICKYCGGSGQDIFNKLKPCPNCNKNKVMIEENSCSNCGEIINTEEELCKECEEKEIYGMKFG